MLWRHGQDERAVSPVIATILLVAIVVVLSATVFVLTGGFRGDVNESAPLITLVSESTGYGGREWQMKLQTAMPAKPLDHFLFVMRTAQNGTLVSTADSPTFLDAVDFWFTLGPSAGDGIHTDNATLGATGLGGFHFRISDNDGDEKLGGGDRFEWWYDGDGDGEHATNADDPLPPGTYGFEIKHVVSGAYVALDERDF